jgi:hypothetical protein
VLFGSCADILLSVYLQVACQNRWVAQGGRVNRGYNAKENKLVLGPRFYAHFFTTFA